MRDRWCTRRRLQAIGAFALLLISAQLLYTLVRHDGYPRFRTPNAKSPNDASSGVWKPAPEPKFDDPCKGYTRNPSIITVVKTGATEASRRLPPAMISYLSCAMAADDVLIFSDLDQHLGGLHIYDALDTSTAKENNTDFKLYYDQQRYVQEGQEIGILSSRSSEAWALDKYKNIHTAQKAWRLKPGKEWYFFIDADTYVVWPSLFALLGQYDAKKPYYIGTASESHRVPWGFAHGGSGYALSRAAMQLLVGGNATAIAAEFDQRTRNECCGDIVFSWSMADVGVNLTNAHPMINGDWANNYRFGPGLERERWKRGSLWCKPLVTMHHVNEVEMGDFWALERRRERPERPLLFRELWDAYAEPHLPEPPSGYDSLSEEDRQTTFPAEREDWDNFSEDVKFEAPPAPPAATPRSQDESREGSVASHADDAEVEGRDELQEAKARDAYSSLEGCKRACRADSRCFQYSFSSSSPSAGGKCFLNERFRFGQRRAPENGVSWHSGWDTEKIEAWKMSQEGRCEDWKGGVDYTSYPEGTVRLPWFRDGEGQ
jgi:hypothetical protein